jgi:predicted RNase H-like HicB family nuclease/DNA-binding XRE family transcriptional regulator
MMIYYAKITKQKSGEYLVEFPKAPGCLTEGNSLPNALKNAKEALNGWLAAHCDRALEAPLPKTITGRHIYPVEVDIQVEFALRLRDLRKKKKLSQSEIAKKLGISQQAYSKLEIPHTSNPSLSTIRRISEALDAEIELRLVA